VRPAAYAGFVTRAVALVLDVLLVDAIALVTTALGGLVLSTLTPGDLSLGLGTALAIGSGWFIFVGGYFVACWALLSRTPGMRLMGLEVAAADGGEVGLRRAILRLGGMALAAIPLGAGFLLALVDDRRQGLQDKVAGTVVLYAPSSRAAVTAARLGERPAWSAASPPADVHEPRAMPGDDTALAGGG